MDRPYRVVSRGIRRTSVLILTCTLLGVGAGSRSWSPSVSAQGPDPCALLMASEIEDISGGEEPRLWQRPFATQPVKTTVANGVASSNDAIGTATCRYTWGTGTSHFRFDVVVSDASRAYLRTSPDQIKQELQGRVKTGTDDEVITGVGDIAVFTSDSYYLATTTALVKGRILRIQLDGLDARDRKDGMIRLLKSAASRL